MREVSGSEIAELTGRTWRTIKEMFERAGVRPKRIDGRAHLYDSETALRVIYAPNSNDTYDDQRQRLAAAQAEKVEHDNAVRRGQLARRAEAVRFWADCIANARAKGLAMPAKLGPRLVNIGDASIISGAIRAEVYAFLAELAEWEPGGRAGLVEGGADDVVTSADPDSDRVERPRTTVVNGKQRRARAVEN